MAPRKTRLKAIKTAAPRKASKLAPAENPIPYLGFGILFGYFLSKSRATDYDSIEAMFLCREFQLYGVIIVSVAVVSLGLFLLRRSGNKAYSGQAVEMEPLTWDPSRLAGTCPGTSLAQIGEGKLIAVATVVGIVAGVWAYKKFKPGIAPKNDAVC